MECVVGMDTSCYTTSVAIMTTEGELKANARRILSVKPGKRGLAQSEMVYQHTRALPDLFEQALKCAGEDIVVQSIGVSKRPRPQEESYMPAFLVGLGYARVIAAALKIPYCSLSHQENHILAGVWSAKGPLAASFLALHVSGGTTEVLKVTHGLRGLSIDLLGGSLDLHAGQFVDRAGVSLGLPFPAGPKLEQLAQGGHVSPIHVPVAVKHIAASFSGPSTHVQRLIDGGADPARVAAGVECCVAETLIRLIDAAVKETKLTQVLLVGGVTANQFIRQQVQQKLSLLGVTLYTPDSEYSSDNAVGSAYYALKQFN